MEEAISLTEIGSISSGKEATRHDSSIFRILAQITVHSSHSRTHRRRNDSTRDAGPRHSSYFPSGGVCIPSKMWLIAGGHEGR